MQSKRPIGTHLQIETSYTQLLEKAHKLGTCSCQFFFLPKDKKKYLHLTKQDQDEFLQLRRKYFSTLYSHGSYWINLSTGNDLSSNISKNLLKKEICIAHKLEIDYIVLHAGNAKGFDKLDGIKALAKILNSVFKEKQHETNVKVLIENTAHGNKAVCSDLQDFVMLKSLLHYPEHVKFCFDTAHAFSYGYDLQDIEQLIDLLDSTMGIENIKLIHLNDSAKPCGSKIDQHAMPGHGLIGTNTLQKIINHPKLKDIPIIIEPPMLEPKKIRAVFDLFFEH